MATKFQIGQVIKRKSDTVKQAIVIIDIIPEVLPLCTKIWYITVNARGEMQKGLKSVIEDDFELVK